MLLRWITILAVLGSLGTTEALSLTDEEIYREFRFNFINPGARSLALGGAFISLADDATAAQANPAGLAYLRSTEYFVEVRAVDNAAQSTITTETLPTDVETFVATGTDQDDYVTPSFLSAVIPFKAKRWTLGISRQEVLNADTSTLSSFAFTFPQSPGIFLVEGTGSSNLEVVNFNVSAGVRVGERWAIGTTVGLSRLDATTEVENSIVDTEAVRANCEILESTLDLRTTVDETDQDFVYNLGMTFRPVKEFGMGVVFRRGPSFRVDETVEPGVSPCPGGGDLDVFDKAALGPTFSNQLDLPSAYGIGGHWRPTRNFMLSMDIERIWYNSLLNGYVPGVNVLTGEDATFTVDDGFDIRAGVEYIIGQEKHFALRGGAFYAPDDTIRAVSTGTSSFSTTEVFAGQGDEWHGTIGLGVNWSRVRADFAADFSESVNEYVVSIIFQGK